MLKISLNNPESGWAYARLSDESKELLVTAPYSPDDVLRDFVDAVQSLQSAEAAECCWSQELGELHWKLRRSNEELELEILRFSQGVIPGHHKGEAASVFKSHTKWVTFARQLLSSLESIKTDMGSEGYERAWGHPFPIEAYESSEMPFRGQNSFSRPGKRRRKVHQPQKHFSGNPTQSGVGVSVPLVAKHICRGLSANGRMAYNIYFIRLIVPSI